MPLDTIYLVRHGNRNNWTIDLTKNIYIPEFPTPTGNPADPTLNASGVKQSHELAVHISGDSFAPKPALVYSSPFYRCLQTIQPVVEELNRRRGDDRSGNKSDLGVRVENGLGEWFGGLPFHAPQPSPSTSLVTQFPTCLTADPATHHQSFITPPSHGETLPQLHDRVAATLSAIIAQADAEINTVEAKLAPNVPRTSKAILISTHAAPMIAMGRALTGQLPSEFSEKDFYVFTAGLSTFVRKRRPTTTSEEAPVPNCGEVSDWRDGKGIGGGWECVRNGETSFLSAGPQSGWHFEGEASFDTSTTMVKVADGDVTATVTTAVVL
ncbi:histidine phosphatase superfamily [Aspergillus pseudoustus]|uniref:Histidine phosphatase superfamily n=1 Tax=Aspergillus pseudoustus TaxID=1810923 RepID=A0ABR4KGW4_9EURO